MIGFLTTYTSKHAPFHPQSNRVANSVVDDWSDCVPTPAAEIIQYILDGTLEATGLAILPCSLGGFNSHACMTQPHCFSAVQPVP